MNERCTALKELTPTTLILGRTLGEALDDTRETARCRGEEGHDGEHWATVQPFPGFADAVVRW